jgi:hypothetical protein
MLGHVTALAAPASLLICSVASVRAQLTEIASGDTSHDSELARLIRVAAAAVAGADGIARPPMRARWQEARPGDGGHYLLLSRWPIEVVAEVTFGVSDPAVVSAACYSVVGDGPLGSPWGSRDKLYARAGWSYTSERCARGGLDPLQAGTRPLEYSVSFTAGWIAADQVADWSSSAAKTVGLFARPTSASSAAATQLRYECTTAGTTGGTEPAWPTTAGETVTDGGVVWTARQAAEVPEDVQQAAIVAVVDWYRGGLSMVAGIQSERHGTTQVDYDFVGLREELPPLPPASRAILRAYR